MYKHILIPTDGSSTAQKAVEAGIDFARESGASVTFFTAVPEYEVPLASEVMAHKPVMSMEEHERRSAEKAGAILAPSLERARTCGVTFDADHALSDRPYEAIIDAARRHGCDAIYMSSHARTGLSRLLHGSETLAVLSHSDIPTMVLR
ncbi:MAG TPA: universal stress protein [Burkholderiales bacterium]|nr:universal stress protein [Burkholderiales bacterium]